MTPTSTKGHPALFRWWNSPERQTEYASASQADLRRIQKPAPKCWFGLSRDLVRIVLIASARKATVKPLAGDGVLALFGALRCGARGRSAACGARPCGSSMTSLRLTPMRAAVDPRCARRTRQLGAGGALGAQLVQLIPRSRSSRTHLSALAPPSARSLAGIVSARRRESLPVFP